MTNFLSSAMLSAGAACFDSIIKIESNMSQAEIKTLEASEEMMKAQPLMLTALQSSYNAQADDQFVSGLISGLGDIGAGALQFTLTKMGENAGDKAYDAPLEPGQLRGTSEKVETATPKASVEGKNEIELDDLSKKPEANDSTTPKAVEKEVAVEKNEHTTDAEREKAKKKAEKKVAKKQREEAKKLEEETRTREQRRQTAIQTYQSYAQCAGTAFKGAATAGSSYFNADGTRKGGSAQAMGTVITGNQTAQGSNKEMAQTYKEAFTNASQILAGIVSAQRG